MASEPTDLIRAVDAALAQEAANEGGPIVDDPAALVRRLRNALEASDAELDGVGQALALAEIRVNHFRAYAEDVAAHGMRADLNPTLGRVMTADETVGWAYSYLRRVDAWVRGAANRTLDTDPGDSGLPPLPPEHRFLNLNPYSQKPSDTEAALAEANATIERVKALADTYGYTPNMTSVHHEIADQITRAIDGAPDPRRVETAEELDALPFTAVIRETLPLRATGNDLSRVWEKWRDGWMCIGGKASGTDMPELPLVVLWLPEVSS